jgi:hypothetical protein
LLPFFDENSLNTYRKQTLFSLFKMLGFMSKGQTESLNKKARFHLSENQALSLCYHLFAPGKDG